MRRHFRKTPLTLGTAINGGQDVRLSPEDRESHVYIAGATRTGKSKLIEHLIRQDIGTWRKHRCGMLLLDPHGSLYRDVMQAVAARGRTNVPIIPIDLTDPEYTVSYDPLRKQEADESAIVKAFVHAMAYVWGEEGTNATPRFERWATGLLHALYQTNLTLVEANMLLSPKEHAYRQQTLPGLNGMALEHWQWAGGLTMRRFEEEVESTVNRMQRFRETEKLRLMLGAGSPSFDFGQAIEEGWIVLVNLSTEGAWGLDVHAETLATLMLTDLWTAAKARGKQKNIRPFRVYIDEFQNFITPTIAKNLAQAAGFGLHLTLATQFPTQLLSAGSVGEDIYRNVMGNARSKIVFSLEEPESLKVLSEWLFRGVVDPDQIKDEIYTTKVLGSKTITLRGSSETETNTTSEGTTTSWGEDGSEVSSSERDQSSRGTSSVESEHDRQCIRFLPILESFKEHASKVFDLDLDLEGRIAAVVFGGRGFNNKVSLLVVYDVDNETINFTRKLTNTNWKTDSPCAISADGKIVAITDGKSIYLLDSLTGQQNLIILGEKTENLSGLQLSLDGSRLCAYVRQGEVAVWDVSTGIRVDGIKEQQRITSMGLSPNGNYLAVTTQYSSSRQAIWRIGDATWPKTGASQPGK